MKRQFMLRKVIFITLISLQSSISFSQEADFILSQFFATQLEEIVFLRWTIEKGNTCQDTYVERSEDGINYEQIELIGGICGSPDASITYEHHDSMPLQNRTTYYRLQLGQYGYTSPVTTEFIRYNDQGYLLAPNPFKDFTRLVFENTSGEQHLLQIIDPSGRMIIEKKTSGNDFIIPANELGTGMFNFRLFRSGNLILEGKLMVI